MPCIYKAIEYSDFLLNGYSLQEIHGKWISKVYFLTTIFWSIIKKYNYATFRATSTSGVQKLLEHVSRYNYSVVKVIEL